ncbi:MAG: class I SAM-dependent methyltransferase [Chlorobi bacterium]|nr:class I SAM-dependent methyltransferase [Chlorobiota bacterium]
MDKKSRWELAQEYEQNWWKSVRDNVDMTFYETFAEEVKKLAAPHIKIKSDTNILEIGSGAAGIITHFKESGERYAIDPLEDLYSSVENFTAYRDETVKYFNGKGEALPFPNQKFDLILIDNVLDHCEDPPQVMNEIKRTLKKNGIVFFRQNTYNLWGKFVRRLMEKALIDKGHPFTFTKKNLLRKYFQDDYEILFYSRSGYFKTWVKELTTFNKKNFIKALLFVTRDKATYILRKK